MGLNLFEEAVYKNVGVGWYVGMRKGQFFIEQTATECHIPSHGSRRRGEAGIPVRRRTWTSASAPNGRYSTDGGACRSGREGSPPRLHRTRAPSQQLAAGKRAPPTAALGRRPDSMQDVQPPLPVVQKRAPASRSTAKPSTLPAANQPGATITPRRPLCCTSYGRSLAGASKGR